MDKRKNKILIGCLALLLVMTVGYALFSETITINGTATAKGDFNIEYTCEVYDTINRVETGECVIEGNTITTTSMLTKPTDGVTFRIKVINKGSIPVILKTFNSSNNYNQDGSAPGDEMYFDPATALGAYSDVFIDGDLGSSVAGDSAIEAQKFIVPEFGKSNPQKYMDITITHLWGDTSNLGIAQPVPPKEGFKMTYTVTLGFEQVTAQ